LQLEDEGGQHLDIDFSGEGEAVVQAGTVHGGVHFHGSKPTGLPVPRQLPSGTAIFINREPILAQLNELLTAWSAEDAATVTPTVVVSAIAGAPGVGKTALVLHWAHQVRHHFLDGDLYIDMRGYGSVPSLIEEQALDKFLRSLSVPPELIPIDIDERAALYRSVVSDKRLLIVIDNVASVRQVRRLLPGSRHCFVVITSRSSLPSLVAREGATRVTLDVLSPDDAISLLAEIIGDERVDREYDAAARIAELCSYLPLALRVVAERAAGRPHLSLAELAGELIGEQSRLDALASQEDELINVRAVFSWSYRALPVEQQKIFRSIGLHPGSEFGAAAIAVLVGIPVAAADAQLQELVKVHLAQEVAARRYRTHDLLRAYSTEQALREDRQRARTHAVRRVLYWYLLAANEARRTILPNSQSLSLMSLDGTEVPSFSDVASAMDWYERERLNILASLQQAIDLGQYDIAWRLPVVSDGFFELRSYWREWREIHTEALNAAQTINDALGEASVRRCLGDVCWRFGEHEEALRHYERGTVIAHSIRDPWVEGFSTRGSGLIYQEMGEFTQAIPYFERALEIFQSSDNERGVGMSMISLGLSHRGLGELTRAAEDCENAVGVFRRISDRWSLAWGLVPLGEIYMDMSRLEQARQQFEEAIDIIRDFGDRRSEASGLRQLGQVFRAQDDTARARECWNRALEIFEALEDPRADEVRTLLGDIPE
jgi:tetratricopeptide (TPR) repeat protein